MRTTPGRVKGLLMADYDGCADLTPFIESATVVVDRVSTCALSRNPSMGLTSRELELIERWLAAHYYVMSDQTLQQKTTEGASGAFHGKTADFMQASKYGQTALRIDWSGCLEAIDRRKFARAAWLGTPCPQPSNGQINPQGVSGVFGDNP